MIKRILALWMVLLLCVQPASAGISSKLLTTESDSSFPNSFVFTPDSTFDVSASMGAYNIAVKNPLPGAPGSPGTYALLGWGPYAPGWITNVLGGILYGSDTGVAFATAPSAAGLITLSGAANGSSGPTYLAAPGSPGTLAVLTQGTYAPAWVNGGTGNQVFKMNGAGDAFEFGALSSSMLTDSSNIAKVNSNNNFTASQLPNAVNSYDLGSTSKWWSKLYLGDSASYYTVLDTASLTANRTVTLPDANSTTVVPDTGSSNNFLTAISSAGTISKAQPSSSNLSDSSNIALRNNANAWSVAQYPSANTVDLGQDGTTWNDIYLRNNSTSTHKITATTPTADRTFTLPNADSNPVRPSSAVSNQYLTGIGSDGVITRAQPSSADLSDGPFLSNPMTTLGDLIGGGASGSPARIVGNTTTTPKFLKSLGNGSTAAASLFVQVDLADLSGTSNLAYKNSTNGFTANPAPSVDGGVGLGLLNQAWSGLYIDTNGSTGSVQIVTGTLTGSRTCTLPNADSNPVIPDTGAANNFLTGISSGGVISKAQPSSSNLSDSSNIALRNNSNSWSTAQLPNTAGTIDLGSTTLPFRNFYVRGAGTNYTLITTASLNGNRTFTLPNANSNPVQPASGAAGQFVTGIDSAGVISFDTPSGGTSCDGRLTLTSGTPVTTSDVTAAGNVYFCPYKGNKVPHSNGSSTYHNTFSQITISLSGKTANTNQDIFVYDSNADGIDDTGELVQWTNNTTRATSVTYSLGVPVKNGAVARTFVGTIRITGTTGQCEDSVANRFVWNNYNRVVRPMVSTSSASTWTYSTKTWRQMNGGTGSVQVSFITGLAEDAVSATTNNFSSHSNTNRQAYCGIGLDSTSTNVALTGQYYYSNTSSTIGASQASYSGIPSIGAHTLYPLEAGNGSTTTTFYGSGSDAFLVPGITATYPM